MRDAVMPPGRHALYERHRYSAAIRSGGFLFVSGQVGSREDGTPEPELAAEIRLAFENLRAVLAAGGCTFDDIVDVTMLIVDPERNLPTALEVRADYLGPKPDPALTAMGVTWLAGFRFEMKVIARIPGA